MREYRGMLRPSARNHRVSILIRSVSRSGCWCVALPGHQHVVGIHALSVVRHGNELAPPGSESTSMRVSPRQGVFHQFLEHGGRRSDTSPARFG